MRQKSWQLKKGEAAAIAVLVESLGLTQILATILVSRGLTTPESVRAFLEMSFTDLTDPGELPNLAEGVTRLATALKKGEKILVYGDYDVDGITGTVLLTDLLRFFGGSVTYYLPDRRKEGYGLNCTALAAAQKQGVTLVITVDCGISAIKEAQFAQEVGLDLIITDHHQIPEQMPVATAIINPKLATSTEPWFDLAGVGVAFKVGQALATFLAQPELCEKYLDLVALGTIADLVPLTGENRILVKEGLARINRGQCSLGLSSLIKTIGLAETQISAGQISFGLAPRLNACGRLGQADRAAELLFSTDQKKTEEISRELDQENRLRREIEERIYEEAEALLAKQGELGSLIFLAATDWHPGVIGIVASRLVEKYYRPTILLNIAEGQAQGSGRSIPAFNLYQALSGVADALLSFGGHALAAGLTLEEEKIAEVAQRLQAKAALLEEKDLTPLLSIDAEVSLAEVNEQLVQEIELLAPYGWGNPTPLLMVSQSQLSEVRRVGEGQHLKVCLNAPQGPLEGIGFQLGPRATEMVPGGFYDFVFRPQFNTFRGQTQVQIQIRDFRRSLPASSSLGEKIREVILGEKTYYAKQKEALQSLKEGQNTLLVLGTGRGKSAVFQSMAAYLALLEQKVTLLVYPLRSLVNDQYQRLHEKMSKLGLRVSLASGALGLAQRKKFFRDLAEGQVEIILTTPEFLAFHLSKFAQIAPRIGLFVVDEAHHLARSKRQGYYLLGSNWRELGQPLALAVTATADQETAAFIKKTLDCTREVVEEHVRPNLEVVDQRRQKDKLKYLLKLVDTGERIVIYVNSRRQAVQLAQDLRFYYPRAREAIGFYHGGLNSQQRYQAEKAFHQGTLRVMVTTSAFGEGIDIPDIKHLVLYHLCFSATEFNQLSGRAGRDQEVAKIHLLFNKKDRQLNELILQNQAPTRAMLVKFYLHLRQKAERKNPFLYNPRDLFKEMRPSGFSQGAVRACLTILEDLGLVEELRKEKQTYLHLGVAPSTKLDLAGSLCYLEGQDEWAEFQTFADFVLKQKPAEILQMINRPIVPDDYC